MAKMELNWVATGAAIELNDLSLGKNKEYLRRTEAIASVLSSEEIYSSMTVSIVAGVLKDSNPSLLLQTRDDIRKAGKEVGSILKDICLNPKDARTNNPESIEAMQGFCLNLSKRFSNEPVVFIEV